MHFGSGNWYTWLDPSLLTYISMIIYIYIYKYIYIYIYIYMINGFEFEYIYGYWDFHLIRYVIVGFPWYFFRLERCRAILCNCVDIVGYEILFYVLHRSKFQFYVYANGRVWDCMLCVLKSWWIWDFNPCANDRIVDPLLCMLHPCIDGFKWQI